MPITSIASRGTSRGNVIIVKLSMGRPCHKVVARMLELERYADRLDPVALERGTLKSTMPRLEGIIERC